MNDLPSDRRRRGRVQAPLSEALSRWMAEHTGQVRVALRARGDVLDLQLDRPDAPGEAGERLRIPWSGRGESHGSAARPWVRVRGLAILAVDDEPRALTDIKRLLETSASVERVATATSAKEALVYLSGGRYDALFLDVAHARDRGHGPGAPAAALRRPAGGRLPHRPPRRGGRGVRGPGAGLPGQAGHARAARVGARARRAARARRRGGQVRAAGDGAESAAAGPDVVAVDNPKGGGKRLVRLETISFAQANGDYARIVCEDGRFLLRTPLSQLEKDWAATGFARVHRAYLVNLKHAVELRAQLNGTAVLIMRDDTEIPVARRNVAALRRRLHA